jgi:hypothetical protein
VVIPRDTDDTHVRRRRVVLDYTTRPSAPTLTRTRQDVLVSDEATAPQPVSPKLAMTLCLRAAQMCLLLSATAASSGAEACSALAVADGHGMSSTRSQRFWGQLLVYDGV